MEVRINRLRDFIILLNIYPLIALNESAYTI